MNTNTTEVQSILLARYRKSAINYNVQLNTGTEKQILAAHAVVCEVEAICKLVSIEETLLHNIREEVAQKFVK